MNKSPLPLDPFENVGIPDAKTLEKLRRTAFLLSLGLPGLGQVFQKHYRRGAALFVGFSLLTLISEARWFLPLAAFLAAMEAYRGQRVSEMVPSSTSLADPDLGDMPGSQHLSDSWRKRLLRSPGPGTYRTALFGFVAVFGFCGWLGIFAPVMYPFREQAQINDQIDDLADRIRSYEVDRGELPKTLQEVLETDKTARQDDSLDPWGTAYQYSPTEDGFELRSAGRDRQMNTPDDYVYRFKE